MSVTCPLNDGEIDYEAWWGPWQAEMLLSHLQGAFTHASCGHPWLPDLPIFQEKLRVCIFI